MSEVLASGELVIVNDFREAKDETIHRAAVESMRFLGGILVGEEDAKEAATVAWLQEGGSLGMAGRSATGKSEFYRTLPYIVVNGHLYTARMSGEGDYSVNQITGAEIRSTTTETTKTDVIEKERLDVIEGQYSADTAFSMVDEITRMDTAARKPLLSLTDVDTKSIHVPGVGDIPLEKLLLHYEGFNPGKLRDGIYPMTYAHKSRYTAVAVTGQEPFGMDARVELANAVGDHISSKRVQQILGEEALRPAPVTDIESALELKKAVAVRTHEIFTDPANAELALQVGRAAIKAKDFLRETLGIDTQGFGRIIPNMRTNTYLLSRIRSIDNKPESEDIAKAAFMPVVAQFLDDKDIVFNVENLKKDFYEYAQI